MPHRPLPGLKDAVRDALVFPTREHALVYLMGHQHRKDRTRTPCVAAYAKTLGGKSIAVPRDADLVLGIRNAGTRDVTGTLAMAGDGGGWSGRVVLPARGVFDDPPMYVPPIGGAYPIPLITLQFHDARLDLDDADATVEVLYGALDTETRRAVGISVTVTGELENCVMSTAAGAQMKQIDGTTHTATALPDLSDLVMGRGVAVAAV